MAYSVGLDIGVGSVGFAGIDNQYNLVRTKGKNVIGVRLFDEADSAAERRGHRTNRRRLQRRRWRLRLLDDIFAKPLQAVDPNFLARLKYSYVNKKDQGQQDHYYGGYVFGSTAADQAYHQAYPTIYHLRKRLMEDDQKHDLREVYLAIHHIVKYRGNFLNPQSSLDIDQQFDVTDFAQALARFADHQALSWALEAPIRFLEAELATGLSNSARVDAAIEAFSFDTKVDRAAIKEMLKGLSGNQIDFTKLFVNVDSADWDQEERKQWKMKLSEEDFDEQALPILERLSQDETEFFLAIKRAYDGIALMRFLGDEQSLSSAMIKAYEDHRRDLTFLKTQVRTPQNRQALSEGYTNYLSVDDKKHKRGAKELAQLIEASDASEQDKATMLDRIANDQFAPKQRTKANGLIPYQLHLAELKKILAKQGQYYPFLLDTFAKQGQSVNKIEELVQFRVPYYVGPMVPKSETAGNAENHWVEKNDGQTKVSVTPWNFDQVFNRDRAAKSFIDRLTGTDTYLIGEPTLPRHSLTYETFTVLNELNNIRIDGKRLPVETKQAIVEDLFKKYRLVTKKRLQDYFASFGKREVELTGLADESRFTSSLTSYHDLQGLLGTDFITNPQNHSLLEKIVEIQTVFEDSDIAERELGKLGLEQKLIPRLAKKHYTGWGNLSRKLLDTSFVHDPERPEEPVSIMDLLYTTNKNFMEILHDSEYGVEEWLKSQNMIDDQKDIQMRIDELTTSPANKRGIKQAFNVLDDITQAMGEEPAYVYLEFAREKQASRRTVSRKKRLETLYKNAALKTEFKAIKEALAEESDDRMQDDRLYLYYAQLGRDMYTGQSISIDQLSSHYDIDHIVPRAFIKDDSLENKVLVNRTDNARKTDSATFTADVKAKAFPLWQQLKKLGLISAKKFRLLTRTGDFTEMERERFIARQLVETRQIIKNVAALIEGHFSQTQAVAIRAEVTGELRQLTQIKKDRDINDYHHAQDALLVATAGTYLHRHFPKRDARFIYNEFDYYTQHWLKNQGENRRRHPYSFVVGTMSKGNEDWTPDNLNYLRKVMQYKTMLMTRKPVGPEGALYKETLIAADPKKRLVGASKERQDPTIYGGYTKESSAYMSLVRAGGKNQLVKIPVRIANEIHSGQRKLDDYVQAKVKKFERILLPKISLGQLVEDEGQRFYLATNEMKHNAKQLWLDQKVVTTYKRLTAESPVEDFLTVFDALTSSATIHHFKFYQRDLELLRDNRAGFQDLAKATQLKVLKDVLYELHDNAGWRDPIKQYFKEIGLKVRMWTKLQKEGGIKLTDQAELIYQSPSGLFEKRRRVQDLL